MGVTDRASRSWVDGPREEWWTQEAREQWAWFRRLRHGGTRFISTEKGFPKADRLLAPTGIIYAIVVREPTARIVSYYFWRYRDASATAKAKAYVATAMGLQRGTVALRRGAPSFQSFIKDESPLDGYYIKRLVGKLEGDVLQDTDLEDALRVLRTCFSIVLVTERLDKLDPIVRAKIGWWKSSFRESRQKASPKPDYDLLRKWRPDWRDEIRRQIPLDSSFYQVAVAVSDRQLEEAVRQLPMAKLRSREQGDPMSDDDGRLV